MEEKYRKKKEEGKSDNENGWTPLQPVKNKWTKMPPAKEAEWKKISPAKVHSTDTHDVSKVVVDSKSIPKVVHEESRPSKIII